MIKSAVADVGGTDLGLRSTVALDVVWTRDHDFLKEFG